MGNGFPQIPSEHAMLNRTSLLAIALALTATLVLAPALIRAQQSDDAAAKAKALDQQIVAASKQGSEQVSNLGYLSDMIGSRLTGSVAVKRANDWTAGKMKEYGLSNVHLEPWPLPEGWVREKAEGRILEPDNGRKLSLAALGWTPSTPGKVEGEVVVMTANNSADLEGFRGKLKGKIVLNGPPAQLVPIAEIEKASGSATTPDKKMEKDKAPPANFEALFEFRKQLDIFLQQEGALAVLSDAGKHLGLLYTGGGWVGTERASAVKKIPMASVAHEHYALLHRLATRPAPAKTRIELEITNKYIPGPIQVFNTVGEIRGSEKPDEFVVVGAHLDSWDLGQGTLDNGCGTSVVLEAARILAKLPAPKRTIRFVLFTGEEQGLHGSREYVQQHKDELPRISAALVHDTGTGKVIGLGWMSNREELAPILETELACLRDLGVKELCNRGFGGSDHVSFDRGGVPGCAFNQEIAGYRFGHHSQADTMEMVREDDLKQGAQVMATAALRLANMEKLLPRSKK
jgi:carboxypeptidase Q